MREAAERRCQLRGEYVGCAERDDRYRVGSADVCFGFDRPAAEIGSSEPYGVNQSELASVGFWKEPLAIALPLMNHPD